MPISTQFMPHIFNKYYKIRLATIHDLEQILAIYNHEIITGTANWNDQAVSLTDYQQRFQDLQQQQFPMIVVEDQQLDRIAGYAYYSAFRSISGYRHSVEHSVFIDPSYARQGLGKALMQQLIHLATQQHMHMMVAAIDSENQGSIVLHEQLGFIQTGYMPQIGQKFGQWRDLVLMQLQLNTP
ncbi:N-acetyltransferase family protein [Acinetobacter haemolyticus]|uniref:GNAT family N-acetyltransferase n=1 Tax=Acinetobacter haemolyticus TaxID=29430 RepID=A0AAJ2YWN3_ACIHA|nr:GNAT family N-acetyltransferase [Acinetobacter haemolyticus]APR69034.1 GNAT family N-acetyltransferase [Acinetobacter haemolyticus]NAR28981.1 GNAT family N-acetyltransferase [Acinetobacter haemolyticus]NAR73951.1 GNAT family N-acetyltransferase [Acinetobacter haemolyticus]NAR77149.1 GNAT family N-acetyltransferase [Acinetobacter haemolyticus]NCU24295.1 N-acetyltransferase [Acinetobacter haemolyticus]